jgi:predicted alpha-1,2-mannosidase
MIGQYAHGNEPSHHIAYLYNYVGMPEKTADHVKQICTTLYNNKPDGLCGNEDCGQMSAWYVFSVIGFYPVNPVSGEYVLSVPLVQESALQLPNGNLFHVLVKNASDKNKYIKEVTWNGEPYTKSFIRHFDIIQGGCSFAGMATAIGLVPSIFSTEKVGATNALAFVMAMPIISCCKAIIA